MMFFNIIVFKSEHCLLNSLLTQSKSTLYQLTENKIIIYVARKLPRRWEPRKLTAKFYFDMR